MGSKNFSNTLHATGNVTYFMRYLLLGFGYFVAWWPRGLRHPLLMREGAGSKSTNSKYQYVTFSKLCVLFKINNF